MLTEQQRMQNRERALELLGKMTLEEKYQQLLCFWPRRAADQKNAGSNHPQGIGCMASPKDLQDGYHFMDDVLSQLTQASPHRIPPSVHMEGLTGAMVRGAASFPSGIGRGATFDSDLEYEVGKLIGRQERAVGVNQTLAPVLDVTRDPRMGRYGESYGEDPTLVAAMGTAYAKGAMETQEGPRRTQCIAKHFLAYHNVPAGIQSTECEISERQLREVYAKPFQAAITLAGLDGVMPCYDTLNGEPVHGSKAYLTDLLRGEMGFRGACYSDYSGVFNMHMFQKIAETREEAGKQALEAGMDSEWPEPTCFNDRFLAMLRDKAIDERVLDQVVLRLLEAKFATGLFEEYASENDEQINAAFHNVENKELPLRAARESMVLLKNDGVLPLNQPKKIAVIGCQADDPRYFFGGYTFFSFLERDLARRSANISGTQSGYVEAEVDKVPGTEIEQARPEFLSLLQELKPGIRSLYQELKERLPDTEITYAYGYPFAGDDTSHFSEALAAAREADLVILMLGGKYAMGTISSMGEGLDATHIGLPACQEAFLKLLEKDCAGKQILGVHLDGRPISSDTADRVLNAIIEAWSPAEAGAQAIADVLLGVYNPAGRLSVTVPRNEGQIPIYYNHKNGSSWHQMYSIGFPDYVDASHLPRYAFGHGLSYTSFSYRNLSVRCGDQIEISCEVQNTGSRKGEEVVQLYVSDEYASRVRPVTELQGFIRTELKPDECKRIIFSFPSSQLAFLDNRIKWKVEKGKYIVGIGGASDDIRLSGDFFIREDSFVDGKTRGFFAQAKTESLAEQ